MKSSGRRLGMCIRGARIPHHWDCNSTGGDANNHFYIGCYVIVRRLCSLLMQERPKLSKNRVTVAKEPRQARTTFRKEAHVAVPPRSMLCCTFIRLPRASIQTRMEHPARLDNDALSIPPVVVFPVDEDETPEAAKASESPSSLRRVFAWTEAVVPKDRATKRLYQRNSLGTTCASQTLSPHRHRCPVLRDCQPPC